MRLWLSILALIITASGASARGEEAAPKTDQEAAEKDNAQSGISESLLEMRDPFKQPVLVVEKIVLRSELESFQTESFKLIGVITGADRLRAILADPNGKSHFVSERMKIGTRRGVIKKITEDEVQVDERITNIVGKEEIVRVQLRLPAELESEEGGSKTAQGATQNAAGSYDPAQR